MTEKKISVSILISLVVSILLACGGWTFSVIQSASKGEVEGMKSKVEKLEICDKERKSEIDVLKTDIKYMTGAMSKIEQKIDYLIGVAQEIK